MPRAKQMCGLLTALNIQAAIRGSVATTVSSPCFAGRRGSAARPLALFFVFPQAVLTLTFWLVVLPFWPT